MKITKEQQLNMQRKASRDAEIAQGGTININAVHKSKKAYNRNRDKKHFAWAE